MVQVEARDQRKSPRRVLRAPCGLLHRGSYTVSEVHQIGEGGVLMETPQNLQVGDSVSIVLRVPKGGFFCARLKVIYANGPNRFGMCFCELTLQAKRWIRAYVAAKTEREAESDLP